MSKILRKCLSLGLAVMLLASLSLHGILTASADNKTGDGLAAYAMRAYNEGWVYSWGGTAPGAVDCSGLIYSYVGGGERTTEGMLNAASESGYVSNGVPDIPGIALWQPGHVGVYVGDGMAVDVRDEISNVCYQSVATKSWVMWFKVDGVSYDTNSSVTNDNQSESDSDSFNTQTDYKSEYLSRGSSGSEVWALQERLKELGYFDEDVTGYFGSVTEAALIEFQYDSGLTPDGVYNDDTEYALTSDDAPEKISLYEENSDIEEYDTFSGDSEENVNIPTEDDEEIYSDSDYEDEELQDNSYNLDSEEEEVSDTADTDDNNETSASRELIFTYGDSGDGVSNIQYILINLGYHHYNITGEYDEKTFNSVEFFQLDNDLPATGSVDEQTLNALFIEFANKNSQEDNSTDSSQDDEEPLETAFAEGEVTVEKTYLSSWEEISDSTNENSDSEVSSEVSDEIESIETYAEISDSDTNSDTETAAVTAADTDTDTDTTNDTTSNETVSETVSAAASGTVKSGGTGTPTGSSDSSKSPKTGDPLVMSIQSAVDYIENYANTTLVLIIIGISCIVIFFAGTVHYWNVSMEKRRQRARKATTVSAFRRGSM